MPTIHSRIKTLRENAGMSRATMAERCKVTQQAVYGWEELGATPSHNRLRTIAEVLNTTTEYLSSGIDVNVPLAQKYTLVRLLGTDKEGGSAVNFHDEVGGLVDDVHSFAYRRDFLARLGVAPEHCRVYMAENSGMRLGEQLLIDTSQTAIENDKVFLLDTPAGVQVRRLHIQLDGSVRVIADDAGVPQQVVPSEVIKLIGKVVAHQGAL
jgi:transcriptional regulator with XRE-family HTH domain